jgi:uncharacterized protein YaaQ
MKQLVFVILQNTDAAHRLFKDLHAHGYNGTTASTSSISRTLLEDPDFEPIIGNLRQVISSGFEKNVALYIIVEENRVEEVKKLIRQATDSFTSTRGGMAVIPLVSFEGSF